MPAILPAPAQKRRDTNIGALQGRSEPLVLSRCLRALERVPVLVWLPFRCAFLTRLGEVSMWQPEP